VYGVRYGRGKLPVTHDDYPVDWETLKAVVVDRIYASDYAGAVVVDIGSHKGYFGAYAIEGGARAVVSLEPEAANFDLLTACERSYRRPGVEWQLRQAAVAAEAGEADLHVMDASWGHALQPPREWEEFEVGTERVRLVAMADLLAEAAALAGPDAALLVKINAEGSECPMVLGTPPEAWRRVTQALVATHPWAACDADGLAAHLELAGLVRRRVDASQILWMAR
jgi:FkbM family methyltransferase